MVLRSFLLAAGAVAAFVLGGPALAQGPAATEVAPAGAAPGPALWQVGNEETTIYLFGTVHILPPETQWLDARIESALLASDEVVFEIDMADTAAMQQVVAEKSVLEGEQTLREIMAEEDRARYEAALQGFGIPLATFDRSKPWLAAMTLSVLPLASAGYAVESGVEVSLSARTGDRTRSALETIEEQIGLFDTMPMDVQLAYLNEVVEAVPRMAADVDQMVAYWLEGDAASLADLLNEQLQNPEIHRRLLADRNANWAEWIEARMERPGTVFIAVGAGHLAGRDSVQQLLGARGMDVVRIWQ